jgi:hypothetical protein
VEVATCLVARQQLPNLGMPIGPKQSFPLIKNTEGSFEAFSVLPGNYWLNFILRERPTWNQMLIVPRQLASLLVEVEIPDGPLSEPVDLGSFGLQIVEP